MEVPRLAGSGSDVVGNIEGAGEAKRAVDATDRRSAATKNGR